MSKVLSFTSDEPMHCCFLLSYYSVITSNWKFNLLSVEMTDESTNIPKQNGLLQLVIQCQSHTPFGIR